MRLFIGIPVKGKTADYLIRKGESCRTREEDTPALKADLHLTLRYIGEADPEKVAASLESVKAGKFSLNLSKMGMFESKPRNVLWAGVSDAAKNLHSLKAKIDSVVGGVGSYYEYHPHISLIFSHETEFRMESLEKLPIEVDSFTLYRINEEKTGQQFFPLREFRLLDSVTVIDVNDFHAEIERAEELTNAVNTFREQNGECITLYGGDNYFFNPMSEELGGETVSGIMKAQKTLFSAVGNHDWEYGRKYFDRWQKDGGYSFLCSNAETTLFRKWGTTECGGKKIGFIGFATDQDMPSPETADDMCSVRFLDTALSAEKAYGELGRENPDAVIALTHFGLREGEDGSFIGDDVKTLASLPFFDGIFAAHWHQFVASHINGVPVAEGGSNGRGFSWLRILFDGSGRPVVEPGYLKLDENEFPKRNPEVALILEKGRLTVGEEMFRPICTLSRPLPNMDPVTHEMKMTGTALGNLVSSLILEKTECDCVLFYSGRMGKGLEKGELSLYSYEKNMTFENRIVLFRVKGSVLWENINMGLRKRVLESLSPIAVAGMNIVTDSSQPYGERLLSVTERNGKPLDMEKIYSVACDVFIASGSAGFTLNKYAEGEYTSVTVRELLKEALLRGREESTEHWVKDIEEEKEV